MRREDEQNHRAGRSNTPVPRPGGQPSKNPDYDDGLTAWEWSEIFDEASQRSFPPDKAAAGGTGQRGRKRLPDSADDSPSSAKRSRLGRPDYMDGLTDEEFSLICDELDRQGHETNGESAHSQHKARAGYDDLPPELQEEVARYLATDNARETARNLGKFKRLNRKSRSVLENSGALGRLAAILKGAGNLAKDLHHFVPLLSGPQGARFRHADSSGADPQRIAPYKLAEVAAPSLGLVNEAKVIQFGRNILGVENEAERSKAITRLSGSFDDIPQPIRRALLEDALEIFSKPSNTRPGSRGAQRYGAFTLANAVINGHLEPSIF